MKMKYTSLCFLLLFAVNSSFAKDYKLTSPDGKIVLTITSGTDLKWSASYDGKEIISSVNMAMVLENGVIPAEKEPVKKVTMGKINQILEPVIAVKHSRVADNCNTMQVVFKSGNGIQFRAYNDGVAYRFETAVKTDIIIKNEITDIQFPAGSMAWYPLEESMMSHNERIFIHSSLDTIGEKHLASLPTLFVVNGVNVLLTESDIEDYAGMWIRGGGSGKITGLHPKYPDAEKAKTDRDIAVTKTRDYIAQTKGTRTFPWRVFIIAGSDGALLESELVYKLAKPSAMTDTKWIKPGQVAWDWWNANNIYGVDFRAGINNDTYKYYIDFASENGIEYVILDEGWYKRGTVLESIPGIDVPELCRYAESKNVGIILWVVWKTFEDKMEEAAALYEKWGVKGVKVDFMQRDDQPVVNFYYRAMQVTADHHLLIDFHGAYKPDGAGRTFPNAITREGVRGLENSKWSKDITPDHDLTLPFTRMVTGPMDYTPGAMINMDRSNFYPQFTRPSSQGTRAHQMALYVVFESPLQMLADSPSNYKKEKDCTDFLVGVPVVWDDLKVLEAKTGDYLVLARRSGNDWFIGALTDWTARDFEIELSFLPAGNYSMTVFQDGINADRYAQDFKKSVKNDIKPGDKIKIHLAQGGGWVAKLTPGN
jgi:alpha-glucosidase